MIPREEIHSLLNLALTEISASGEASQNKVLFHLAHLYQPVPLGLERAARGELSYDDVLADLEGRASRKGITGALESAKEYVLRWRAHEGASLDSRALLYDLLDIAVIDLRGEASQASNEVAWCVAHVIHNLPPAMERASRGEIAYEEVREQLLRWLRDDRPPLQPCAQWLERALADAAKPRSA